LEAVKRMKPKLLKIFYVLRGGDRPLGMEDENTFRAFHFMLVTLLSWLVLQLALIIPLFALRKTAASAIILILVGSTIFSLYLLRRHRRRAAAALFLTITWCVSSVFSLFSNGIHSAATGWSFVLIILAGWLLGRYPAISLAAASTALLLVEAVMEVKGHPLPTYFPSGPIEFWTVYVLFVLLAIIPILYFLEELKRQLIFLRESEERFSSLSNAAQEGIMIHKDGSILDANIAFARLFGYEHANDLIGQFGPGLLLAPDSRDIILRRMANRETGVMELTGLRKDGTTFLGETESSPIRYRGQDASLVSMRDITEKKRAEQERDHFQAQLTQAHKMESIGRLAGNIAHDFNNLLTVIIGSAEMLLDRSDVPDSIRENLDEIRGSGVRAAGLTQQLLTFSRKLVLEPRVLDLNHLLSDMKPILSSVVGDDIELRVADAGEPMTIEVDPLKLDSVILNLVVNARDAMPGGGSIEIETTTIERGSAGIHAWSSGQVGDWVALAVRDTGVGMSKETQNHIFEPFFTTKDPGKGTGLGLAVAQSIVEQSGGSLEVQSEPGHGSTFTVYLPWIKDGQVDAIKRKGLPVARGVATVLVTEDSLDVRKLAIAALMSYGYSVIEAETPDQVLPLCNRERGQVDLILADVVMPKMSGKEMANLVRSRWPHIKVLFMSGYGEGHPLLEDILDSGSGYIQKPFSPSQLAAKVQQSLATKSAS
jgi:PAS domain S-box-containing protein